MYFFDTELSRKRLLEKKIFDVAAFDAIHLQIIQSINHSYELANLRILRMRTDIT